MHNYFSKVFVLTSFPISVGYSTGMFPDGHTVARSEDAVKTMYNYASMAQSEGGSVPSVHICAQSNPVLARWAIQTAKLKVVKQMSMMWLGEVQFKVRPGFVYCNSLGY
jgi:hypothetical protein